MIDAREFIKRKDESEGEGWSEDTEELIKAFEEYAMLKVLEELGNT